jgi:hypothetical protein
VQLSRREALAQRSEVLRIVSWSNPEGVVMSAVESQDEDVFLTARAVRRRYGGKSDMALWRWSRDPNLGFPKPIFIQQYRHWRLSDLIEWERSRPTTNPAA